jgi:serine/threonine protein kinase
VLVNTDFTLKICDFGISKDYGAKESDLETETIGTIAFHPPEIYTRKCFLD